MSRHTIAAIRFGTGLSPNPMLLQDPAGLTAALAAPDTMAQRYPVAGSQTLVPLGVEFTAARKARRTGAADGEARYKAARRALETEKFAALRARLMRGVFAADSFRERLEWFWADHFAVSATNLQRAAGPTAYTDEAIRPHLAGSFRDLLRKAVTHPFMLAYLDQNRSIGPASPRGQRRGVGLNENLAREILELHTLGVGAGYTQNDVTQFAELLTGLSFNTSGGFQFRPNWAEPGAELVLGRSYGGGERAKLGDILAALDDIAEHPTTGAHIARKLAVHFVADDPAPDLVAAMTDAWSASDGALSEVYAAMLAHPAAWAPQAVKVRQPFDYIVAAFRALGTSEATLHDLNRRQIRRLILQPLARMGQPYQMPPGPDGWPEAAEAWITPPALAERITWAMNVKRLHGAALPEPGQFVIDALGDSASDTLKSAVRMAESRRAGVGLVLASTEFNRR